MWERSELLSVKLNEKMQEVLLVYQEVSSELNLVGYYLWQDGPHIP